MIVDVEELAPEFETSVEVNDTVDVNGVLTSATISAGSSGVCGVGGPDGIDYNRENK